jgi:hypothetical protein
MDRTNLPPDEVEIDWQQNTVEPTQLDDQESIHSGSVCYRGDTQREM